MNFLILYKDTENWKYPIFSIEIWRFQYFTKVDNELQVLYATMSI